jgi:flagella basal body P-ring formation protein FlgA
MKTLQILPGILALALAGVSAAEESPSAPPAPPSAAGAKSAFTSEQLMAEIARAVAEHFRLEGELKLEPVRPWTCPVASAAVWQVVIDEFPNIATSTLFVRCRVLADGALADRVSLMLRASLWRDAWFARQPIVGRTTFGTGLVEARRIDVFHEHDALPASAGDDSYIFTRDIPADHLVTWHDIARRPLVRKGDVVEVTANEGRLTLSMKALALENGARGDLVTVRNIESRKDLSGMVIDEDHVQVRF